MDDVDDIDIEEHDILEHPLVKAAFPDLSKIEIQVHTGAFYENPPHNEEFSDPLGEIQNFTTNGFPVESSEPIGSSISKQGEDTTNIDNEILNSEDVTTEGNVKTVNFKDSVNQINVTNYAVVLEISDDEPMTEPVDESCLTNNVAIKNGHCVTENIADTSLHNNDSDNIVEISDDEELFKPDIENTDTYLETTETESLQVLKDICVGGNISSVINNVIDKVFTFDKGSSIPDIIEPITVNAETVIAKELKNALNNNAKVSHEVNKNESPIYNDEYITGDLNDYVINTEVPKTISESTRKENVTEMSYEPSETTQIDIRVPIKEEFEEVPIKQEVMDEFDADDYNFDDTASQVEANLEVSNSFNEINYLPNKIILGSKPSPNLVSYVKDPSNAVVVLEDWSERLIKSHSYCHDCQILFPVPNALDYHRMAYHSLLAPLKSANKAVKSTAKSSNPKNVAKKSTSFADTNISTFCSHCNVNFKDNTALIKHLYELLPQKYDCQICNASFSTQNDLVSHNSVHVKTERRILKPKKKLDKNPLLRNLLMRNSKMVINTQVLPIKTEIEEEPTKTYYKYKCQVCNLILNNYTAFKRHKKRLHKNKNKVLFKKIRCKQNRSKDRLVFEDDKPKSKKIKLESNSGSQELKLIPKSSLFQCPKCNLHFTSNISALAHMAGNTCDPKKPKYQCTICKKKIRRSDKTIHLEQHKICSKFKIYKVTKSTNERTLCKCMRCNIHFEYMVLKRHLKNCGKIVAAKCVKCNILVPKAKLSIHMTKHNVLKLKPKDFIFVEYAVSNLDENVKTSIGKSSKIQSAKNVTVKSKLKVKLTQKHLHTPKPRIKSKYLRYFFCKHCKVSKRILRGVDEHLTKACLSYRMRTQHCQLCGLLLTAKMLKDHLDFHKQNKFTIKDIQFFDIATKKRIPTPILKFKACNTCKVHFSSEILLRRHNCGEDYKSCEFCGDRYETKCLKLHREFHIARQSKNSSKSDNTISITKDSGESVISELMMRYESLNPIWNILYSCKNCDIVCDVYNKAVEHSQGHLRKEKLPLNSTRCLICNLNLDETCWPKHRDLHTQMPIKRKAFNVLTYSPDNLLDESWFQMFESLPEKVIRQIIDQSVFGSERSLKMRLIKHGLPEFTLYCCSSCRVCYDNNNLSSHVNEKCKESKFVCKECDIAFENSSTLNFHVLLHDKGIKKEEFRIIHFIKTPKKLKNGNSNELNVSRSPKAPIPFPRNADPKVIALFKSVRERISTEAIDFAEPITKSSRANCDLYRCVKCSMSLIRGKYKLSTHKCIPLSKQFHCDICKQNFRSNTKAPHHDKHVEDPLFKASNLNVYEFDPVFIAKENPKKKKKGKVITKMKKHMKANIKPDSKPGKVTRANPDKDLESDEDLGGDNDYTPKQQGPSITKQNTAKIFKCECGLHFLSMKSIEDHMATCDDGIKIYKETCSKCNLLFPTDVLVTHLCKHHTNDTTILVENIKKIARNTASKSTEKVDSESIDSDVNKRLGRKRNISEVTDAQVNNKCIKFYKCGDCNVHYLNQNTCYKHAYKNHVKLDPKTFIDCKICGLAFTLSGLQNHIRRHHNKELDLDKVLIEEYKPGTGKGDLKIDIYFASQKVQNVQVSSTND